MQTPRILHAPFWLSLLAIAFCFWSAQGNDVNFCHTAGCSLYHDVRLLNISLWWYGLMTFVLLGCLAFLGQATLGFALASLVLFCDLCLLILMAVTAPCLNCLVVAVFFAATYLAFRKKKAEAKNLERTKSSSWLLMAWALFFALNIGTILRGEMDSWAIFGDPKEARVHLYFSPSCPRCLDALDYFAGNWQVAFFPVADQDQDVHAIATMQKAIEKGASLKDALTQAHRETEHKRVDLSPATLLLQLRLLRNKAHVLRAGSRGVPYLEYRGLPSFITLEKTRKLRLEREKELQKRQIVQEPASQPTEPVPVPTGDADILLDPLTGGQCTSAAQCN